MVSEAAPLWSGLLYRIRRVTSGSTVLKGLQVGKSRSLSSSEIKCLHACHMLCLENLFWDGLHLAVLQLPPRSTEHQAPGRAYASMHVLATTVPVFSSRFEFSRVKQGFSIDICADSSAGVQRTRPLGLLRLLLCANQLPNPSCTLPTLEA